MNLNVHRQPRGRPRRACPASARCAGGRRSSRRRPSATRGCWPSGRSGSGCCRRGRFCRCARARPRPPARSRCGSAPWPAAAGGREDTPVGLGLLGGVRLGRDAGCDHDGAAVSHGAPPRGSGGAVPERQGVRRGAQQPLAQPQCSTLSKLAPDTQGSGASCSGAPFPSFVSWPFRIW